MEYVEINAELRIPRSELSFTAVRSGGPGGQHVNKVSTSVALAFDVEASPSLDEGRRARIRSRLAGRISQDGVLRVTASDTRSQAANKELAVERFAELLRQALHRDKPRRRTRPTRASKTRRLQAKKTRAAVKKLRGRVRGDE
ncbi:alternative ribosome rescue aminoacyl-tRNA hydrolase ArfB [Desulfocurvus sp. DL9XJH121]